MSRVIVKNLPSNFTEAKLRNFYKDFGSISDCSLKYTKEGTFRRFAFVGFESENAAREAIAKTNQTFINSYKIIVEDCKPFGDESKPRAWSKHAKDSSAYKRINGDAEPARFPAKKPREARDEQDDEQQPTNSKKDEEFQSFLEAKGVAVKGKEVVPVAEPPDDDDHVKALVSQLLEDIKGDTSLSLLLTGLPASIKQKHVKDWLAPVRVKALKVVRDSSAAVSFVSFDKGADVKRALLKNGQFLGGYRIGVRKLPQDEQGRRGDSGGGNAGGEEGPQMSREEEEAKVRDAILETGRLFLRNLPYSTTADDVRVAFKAHGELADVQVIIAKSTGQCKGFAIVEYVFPESAVAAYAALDGSIFKGRMMHILPGQEKREQQQENGEGRSKEGEETEGGEGEGESKGSYKKKKAEQQKKTAGKAHSWNALFLGPNAVADTLAEKLGVAKADILTTDGGESAAVRLALAETRLVRETRQFLIDNGVRLDAFSRPATKRSDTVILVKNLPAGVQQDELRNLFEKHGDLRSVLIPPEGGVTALIVYGNSVDAKKAFQSLAYARFRTQPLYLEWAPADVLEREEGEKMEEGGEEGEGGGKKKRKRELTEDEKREERRSKKHRKKEAEEAAVKEELKEEEEEKPKKNKKDKKDNRAGREEEEEDTDNRKDEEGEGQGEEEEEEEREIEDGAAVFVKNLSFETTDESLAKLFTARHAIASAKVSRKFNAADPSRPLSMGFGFVQFYTKDEATEAIKTMQGSLLDGHAIELKLSNRETDDEKSREKARKSVNRLKQGNCTKIHVRNIPFQASPREVESLFSSFGTIKSVRIPLKVGGGGAHRGFCFVDFATKGEAKRAFEALVHSTHVYGRRLVLEWAKGEEESVDELREKTAARYAGDSKEQRKMKKRMEAIEKDLKVIDDD